MVEMDPEDERFVDGIGGYSMPLMNEEVTPDDEEGTSNSDDSEYEVALSDASDEDISSWMVLPEIDLQEKEPFP